MQTGIFFILRNIRIGVKEKRIGVQPVRSAMNVRLPMNGVRPAEKGPTSVSCYSIALAQNWKTILWIGGIDFCDFLLRQRRALLP